MKKSGRVLGQLLNNTKFCNQSWFTRNPSALLLQRLSKTSQICYSNEIDPSKLFDIFEKKMTPEEKKKLGLTPLYRSFRDQQPMEPLGNFLDSTLKEALVSKNHELALAHKSSTDEQMRAIVSGKRLENRADSKGVANQPGIFMFTDVLGKALAQVITGDFPHPVVYAGVENELMSLGQSWFSHGDRSTFKCMDDELPITPHAMFTLDQKLEVLHAEAFVQHHMTSLILGLEIEKIGILEIMGIISHFAKAEIQDGAGNHYTFEELENMPLRQLLDIMDSTLFALAIAHDEKNETFHSQIFKRSVEEMRDSIVQRVDALNRFFHHHCKANPNLENAVYATPGFVDLLQHSTTVRLSEDKRSTPV